MSSRAAPIYKLAGVNKTTWDVLGLDERTRLLEIRKQTQLAQLTRMQQLHSLAASPSAKSLEDGIKLLNGLDSGKLAAYSA